MTENEALIGELLQLKDDIAQYKEHIRPEWRSEWETLKTRVKALEPNLSGTLLTLVKRKQEIPECQVSTDEELHRLLLAFGDFRQKVWAVALKDLH